MSLRRKIFYGFTLAVLAVLLFLPATGWLARMQLLPFGRNNPLHSLDVFTMGTGKADTAAALARFVAARPNDFDFQFAHAMNRGSEESLPYLEALDKKFPENPTVIAARLIRMTGRQVLLRRGADDALLLPPSRLPKAPVKPEAPSDPETVAKFIAIAEQGERVAPTNAFFSAMVAAGNFARRRDADAVAAWKRAGAKPDWDDYALAEMNAKWKLQIAHNGGTEVGFMPRAASSFAILLPHYAFLRASTRMATVKAVEAELAGDRETGIAVRGATRRIGAGMMTRSNLMLGVLVGRAVIGIGSGRPGGAPALDTSSYTQAEKDANRAGNERVTRYVAYLRSAGHPAEAAAFAAASRDGDVIKQITRDAMGATYMGLGDDTFRLLACWYGCILLLAGVLSSLTFAGIFKLIYRFSPRLQKSEVLQPSARWGVMLGLALPCLAGVVALNAPLAPDLSCGGALVAAALLLIVPPIAYRLSAKSVGHGLLVLLATLATLAVIGSVGAATWYMFEGPIGAAGALQGMSGGDSETESVSRNAWTIVLPAVISLIMMSLPLILLAVFAGFSRMLRIPVAAGVTRGMRAMAVPLACVMILGWAVCLVATLRHENAAIAQMKRAGEVGEPRMQAELLGKTYPPMTEGLRLP